MHATAEPRPNPMPEWGNAPAPGPTIRRLWEAWWAMPKAFRITAMVLGFVAWWPIGLTLLLMTFATKRFGRDRDRHGSRSGGCGWRRDREPEGSGNRAFDAYREETLKRLEEEQREFGAFLERLRFARDKSEFDQFMAERRRAAPPEAA